MARDPAASLPQQQPTWKAVKALYRLLNAPDVPFEALLRLHWQQTRAALAGNTTVLLVQDPTELDLSPHTALTGLGQMGTGTGRGVLLQTVWAVLPETSAVLGCLAQQPVVRVPAPPHERRSQRSQRCQRPQREPAIWPARGGAGGAARLPRPPGTGG
jgi:hypothetical protein